MESSYEEFVMNLKKSGKDIQENLSISDYDIIHMAMGLAGEVGELVDAVKKATIYNQKIDMENIKEELGDLEFYMEGMRQAVGLKREEIIEHNMNKLKIRYGDRYSDQAAKERKDKQ